MLIMSTHLKIVHGFLSILGMVMVTISLSLYSCSDSDGIIQSGKGSEIRDLDEVVEIANEISSM